MSSKAFLRPEQMNAVKNIKNGCILNGGVGGAGLRGAMEGP